MKTPFYFFSLLIFFFTAVPLSNAQEFIWAKKAGYYAFDYGYGVCADAAGNIYCAGKYEMDSRFDDVIVPCDGNHDIFTVKYGYDGALKWVRVAGGEWGDYAHAMTCDEDGNVYITGEIEMTVKFHESDISLSSWGSNDMFIAKYDTDGNLKWANRGGGRGSDQGLSVAVYGDAVYVAGKFKDTAMFHDGSVRLFSKGDDDIFLAKYGTDGSFKWIRRAGGELEDEAWGVTVDDEGMVYITGFMEHSGDFNGVNYTTKGGRDAFIAKYDPSGNFKWVKFAGGLRNDMGTGIKAGKDGRIYVTGAFRENASWGGINLTAKRGDTDIFTACYTKDGEAVWVKKAGGDVNDRGMAIATDSESNVYITGYFGLSAEFDKVTVTAADSADIFVAKYTRDGDFVWVLKADGVKDHPYKMGTEESGRSIWVDNNNYVIVAGSFRSDAKFGEHYLQGWEHTDIFVAKIKQPESKEENPAGINQLKSNDLIDIFPNPSNGLFTVQYLSNDASPVRLLVKSPEGQSIIDKEIQISSGLQHSEIIDLSGFPAGVYFVSFFKANEQIIKKIIVSPGK
jgi:hypothetical protein